MITSDLHSFFSPKSVAIVGASADYRKVGHLVAKNMLLQGYMYKVYFVNPKGDKILGHDTFKDLSSLPHPVDLVVFATPAGITLDEIEKHPDICKHAVILAAGFKEEHGDAQTEHEMRLQKILTTGHVRILGPNCAGFINAISGLNSTFLVGPVPVGNVGFISQSGALGSIMIDTFAAHHNLGFSYFFSLGNKSDIDECDALEYLVQDEHTHVIAMYLEDVHDGARFIHTLSEATKHKPVVIIKSGASASGAKAAVSHTGSLAGDDAIFDAVVHQCGAMRAISIGQFLEIVKICSYGVRPKADNLIVVTNAGGCGVLAADAMERNHLKLAQLHISGISPQKSLLPNPYDVRGDADASKFATVTAETGNAEKVGGVVVIVTPQANTQLEETAKALVGIQSSLPHPLYPVFLGDSSMDTVQKIFEQNRMPFFQDLERVFSSLGLLTALLTHPHRASKYISKKRSAPPSSSQTKTLTLTESYTSLQKAGIELLASYEARTAAELHDVMAQVRYPIVMKLSSTTITHKSDAGGVKLNIRTFEEAESTYMHMQQMDGFEKVMIQEMVSGYELIFGAKRDPVFGPIIVMGIGGVLTNVVNEAVQLIPPVGFEQFTRILAGSKIAKILSGYRGFTAVPIQETYRLIHALSELMTTTDLVEEVDINPVIVTKDGRLVGVDARVVVRE